jgi:O-antigen/teichoic acid export membrane protein
MTYLKAIAKGTGLVFIGTVLGTLLGLILRVIVVRYITPSEFGLLSLGLVIVNILITISCLGFRNGVPRYISYALGQKDYFKVWQTIKSALTLALGLSLCFCALLFAFPSAIAQLFHQASLVLPLRILSLLIPLSVLIDVLVAILRGFADVKAKVYFKNILVVGIKIILVVIVIILGLAFKGVLWAYLGGNVLSAVALIYYARKKIHQNLPKEKKLLPSISHSYLSVARELLVFSLPLLGSSVATMIIGWTDTLMLAYFKTSEMVGLYNAALSLTKFLTVPLSALSFIYLPFVSKLFARKQYKEINKLYSTVTQWTFLFTLPAILVMLFAPKAVLHLFFGRQYIAASVAMQLLTLGEAVHICLGPNGMTILAGGKTKIIFICTLGSAMVNILLNCLLIPRYDLAGAAIASAVSLMLVNILFSVLVFKFYGICPYFKGRFTTVAK